jgi:hypothetical protein
MHALPFAIPLGQLVPLRSGPQYPEDAIDEQAVVPCGSTWIGLLARQHFSDTRPLLVVELVSLRHALRSESVDPKRNESEPIPGGNPECRLDLEHDRFRLNHLAYQAPYRLKRESCSDSYV